MKKDFTKKIIFSATTMIFLFAFGVAYAQVKALDGPGEMISGLEITGEKADIAIGTTTPMASLANLAGGAVNSAFAIVAVVFVTVIMIGGFLWMSAAGNEENIAKAKKFVINGISGLIAIMMMYALVYVILYALNASIGGNQ